MPRTPDNRDVQVVRIGGRAADFITRAFPEPFDELLVQVYEVARPTLVLGNSQREDQVDEQRCRRDGVDVVTRRSGGGAVYLEPARSLWIDVLVPRGHPRWSDDVGLAGHWLGEAWIAALRQFDVSANLYVGRLEKTKWGRLVCFGALGPGEVVLDGRKLVGVAHRRSLQGARMQCLVLDSWQPVEVTDRLLMSPDERAEAVRDLKDLAVGSPVALTALSAAFLEVLSRSSLEPG